MNLFLEPRLNILNTFQDLARFEPRIFLKMFLIIYFEIVLCLSYNTSKTFKSCSQHLIQFVYGLNPLSPVYKNQFGKRDGDGSLSH